MSEYKPTVLGGWKGSVVMGIIILMMTLISGSTREILLGVVAFCAYMGWGIQEFQHKQLWDNYKG